ncbi:MAG: hypothetical protein KAI97_01380 [Gemmatimonadetes bacterium]|nr:hypothetical protein [Gemmatimonadota bacterium]
MGTGLPRREPSPDALEVAVPLDPPLKATTAIKVTTIALRPINQGARLRVWTDIVTP